MKAVMKKIMLIIALSVTPISIDIYYQHLLLPNAFAKLADLIQQQKCAKSAIILGLNKFIK